MANKNTISVTLTQDKETPGTFRFAESVASGEKPVIGTLYVPKATAEKLGNPTSITITVEAN